MSTITVVIVYGADTSLRIPRDVQEKRVVVNNCTGKRAVRSLTAHTEESKSTSSVFMPVGFSEVFVYKRQKRAIIVKFEIPRPGNM